MSKKRVNFTLDQETIDLLDRYREESKIPTSSFVNDLILKTLQNTIDKKGSKIDSKEKVESVFIQEEIKAPTPKEIEPDISKPLIDDPEYNAMPESNFAEAKAKRMTSIRRHGMDNPAAVQERARLFNLFK